MQREAEPAPDRVAARRAVVDALTFAERVVSPAIGLSNVAERAEMHHAMGAAFSDDDRFRCYEITMIEEAIGSAGPLLALIAMLADAAAERPIAVAAKSNYRARIFGRPIS